MGRKKLDPADRRMKNLRLRVNDAEHDEINAACEIAGMFEETFLREAALKEARRIIRWYVKEGDGA